MPTINLTDTFGLVIDASPSPSSMFSKYVKHPEDNAFKSLRADLEKKLASVAANTKSQFSEPWGLLAMYLASGQLASKSLCLLCPKLTLLA